MLAIRSQKKQRHPLISPEPSSFITLILSLGVIIGLSTPLIAAESPSIYNVKKFGAVGDAVTLDTKAIQSAVDACGAAGGGRVIVPAGRYLVGCIELRNNINLHLSAGAILLGSTQQKDYTIKTPTYQSRTNDLYVNKSIIYAEKVHHVSITGTGIIDGQGRAKSFARVRPQTGRPYLARFIQCEDLTIRDVSMLEAANWTCHLLGCKRVLVDGLKIRNTARANRDGLDIDSCNQVTVSNCQISSQDDAIVIKSTTPDKAQNILITNCIISSHAAGIKMGTESTGGYENITISNCVIKDVNIGGISLMTVDGGVMNNIVINNIIMNRVKIPFMIRLGNRARPYQNGAPTPGIGTVRGIRISNVVVTDALLPSHFTGLHSKSIENISLSHISIHCKNGYNRKPMDYNKVPFKESDYPGARLFGDNLPASVFYCRNVDGLRIDNVTATFGAKDTRIPFVFDGVQGLRVTNCEVIENNEGAALLYLRNTRRTSVSACSNGGKSPSLAIREKENCAITDIASDPLSPQQKPIQITADISDKSHEKIKGAHATHRFNTSGNPTYKDTPYHLLSKSPATFKLKATQGKHSKLMILCANKGEPEWIKVTMNGHTQRIKVSGMKWHWLIVNDQQVIGQKIDQPIKIEAENNKNSSVILAEVTLIPVSVTD